MSGQRLGMQSHLGRLRGLHRQRGVVLFIALIALVAIMLAAVALVRSVDTSSLIAGNISFRRAATASADGGLEAAIAQLLAMQIEDDRNSETVEGHILNKTDEARAYYASLSAPDFFDEETWKEENKKSSVGVVDVSGNRVSYIIERMCQEYRDVDKTEKVTIARKEESFCVFSDAETQNNSMSVGTAIKSSSSVMYRVTIRATGPRNTVSYIQAFIY